MSPAFQRVREILKTALDEATAGRTTPRLPSIKLKLKSTDWLGYSGCSSSADCLTEEDLLPLFPAKPGKKR